MILEVVWEIVARVTVQQQSAGPRTKIGLAVTRIMVHVLLMKTAVMETNVFRVFARKRPVILSKMKICIC